MAGDPAAWGRFQRELRPPLEARAAALLREAPELDPADLVSDLITAKALGTHALLEPVTRGGRALLPLLLHALKNAAIDLLRRRRSGPAFVSLEIEPGKPEDPKAPTPLRETCREHADSLRRQGGLPPPQRATLLLDARIKAARGVRAQARSGGTETLPSTTAATLFPWTVEEATLRTLQDGPTLLEVWTDLAPHLDDPEHRVGDSLVASVMGVSADRLAKWRQRARERLRPEGAG